MNGHKPTVDEINAMTDTEYKVHEGRLRRTAQRQGLRLEKSRRRGNRATDFETYMLVDPDTNTIAAGDEQDGYGLGLDDVGEGTGRRMTDSYEEQRRQAQEAHEHRVASWKRQQAEHKLPGTPSSHGWCRAPSGPQSGRARSGRNLRVIASGSSPNHVASGSLTNAGRHLRRGPSPSRWSIGASRRSSPSTWMTCEENQS